LTRSENPVSNFAFFTCNLCRYAWARTNLVNYANPDPKSLLDAAGKYWVGTAPSNMYKSISATAYGAGQKAEFQIRSLGSDGRSRMLSSMKPGRAGTFHHVVLQSKHGSIDDSRYVPSM
jgi:hypothetical protein